MSTYDSDPNISRHHYYQLSAPSPLNGQAGFSGGSPVNGPVSGSADPDADPEFQFGSTPSFHSAEGLPEHNYLYYSSSQLSPEQAFRSPSPPPASLSRDAAASPSKMFENSPGRRRSQPAFSPKTPRAHGSDHNVVPNTVSTTSTYASSASPYQYYSAYAAANTPGETPDLQQSLLQNQHALNPIFGQPAPQSIPPKSPGRTSIRSVRSSELEDCKSEKSPTFTPDVPGIPEVQADLESHEPTPEFQEALETLDLNQATSQPHAHYHQYDGRPRLGARGDSYRNGDFNNDFNNFNNDFNNDYNNGYNSDLANDSFNNEIRREAQNVRPLKFSSPGIMHQPEPRDRELYERDGQNVGYTVNGGVEYDDYDDDDEHGPSILNSLPTPRVPSEPLPTTPQPDVNLYRDPSTGDAGKQSPDFSRGLQPGSQVDDPRTGSLTGGIHMRLTPSPRLSSPGTGRYSHASHVSQSSYSDGSSRSGESAPTGGESPWQAPSRPRSVKSVRPTNRLSYYDFGSGSSAASTINLNLAEVVAKEAGTNSLLPRMKTIELYRKNAKKSNDPDLEFQLAQYMMQTALIASSQQAKSKAGGSAGTSQAQAGSPEDPGKAVQSSQGSAGADSSHSAPSSSDSGSNGVAPDEAKIVANLFKDAMSSLKRLSERGYADAQYLLGDIYSSPAINNKPDMEKSFKYFAMAGKHNHAEAAYRAALCLQEGWGTSRDARRAVQFYKSAAVRNQPGALYQLGMAYFYGGMGLPDNSANRQAGVKWLTRAVKVSDVTFNRAPYELAKIFEVGYKDLVIPDGAYSANLYSRSAELGFVPAAARLGRAYEYGELGCPQDPSLSIHYFTIAALGNDPNAQLAMCAWYMVGAGPSFPVNREEAYEWCLRAALNGLPKAQYTLGFLMEKGLGTHRNLVEASKWYQRAATNGYEKAQKRVKEMGLASDGNEKGKCLVM